MLIATKFMGKIEVEENQLVHFPNGIPAFEEYQDYFFLPFDDSGFFFYMQSVKDADLCLVVCDPFRFFPDYEVDLGEPECQLLEVKEPQDVALYAILTIPDDFRETTANLLAPLVVNTRNNLGLQFIPTVSDNTTKQRIFPSVDKNAASGEGK